MDWPALALSLKLALATAAVLLPLAVALGRWLAFRAFAGKPALEAFLALPLVLPPTVLGYYLLVGFAPGSTLGRFYQSIVGTTLAFSFEGLLLASIVANIPFAMQPVQRGFEAVPRDVRDAAWVSGMSPWRALWRVELPLAWPSVLTAFVLVFAHTLGEFGVVLMVGGNIPGQTRVASIAIFSEVEALNYQTASFYSLVLVALSFSILFVFYLLNRKTLYDKSLY